MSDTQEIRQLTDAEIDAVAGGCTEAPCPGDGILTALVHVPILADLLPPNPIIPPNPVIGADLPPSPIIAKLFT